MVAYTKTISNTVGVVAGKPAQLWGLAGGMVWGVSNWGTQTDFLQIVTTKLLTNTLTLNDPALLKAATVSIFEAIALADSQSKEQEKTISEALSLEGDASSQTLQDSNGYFYVFRKPSTNNENTVNTAYSSQSVSVPSFTSLSRTPTAWS